MQIWSCVKQPNILRFSFVKYIDCIDFFSQIFENVSAHRRTNPPPLKGKDEVSEKKDLQIPYV